MQTFIEKFATIIEVKNEQLTSDFDLINGSDWDSIGFISTIALVDKCFGIVLDSDALAKVKTFGDLLTLIQESTVFLQEAA